MIETKFKNTEIGMIPQDWDVKNIDKSCTIKARIGWQGLTTAEYLSNGDYILITGTDFENGFINWKSCSFVSKFSPHSLQNLSLSSFIVPHFLHTIITHSLYYI